MKKGHETIISKGFTNIECNEAIDTIKAGNRNIVKSCFQAQINF